MTLVPAASERRRTWCLAAVIVLGSWLILACTAPGIPIVWDEGEYLFRADHIVAWFRVLFGISDPGGQHALSKAVIQQHWLFINYSEGHPAWFAIPIAVGKALLSGPLRPLTAARLGPITVFSIACGAIAVRLKNDDSTIAALVSPIALLTLPRMFSEAHFATQDGQLTAWWLMLWVADSSVRRGTGTAIGVGVLLGLTCSTKFTGWLAFFPIMMSRALARDREPRRELLVLVPVALLTFYAVNPPLWHSPLAGLVEHARTNLGRPDINFIGAGTPRLSGEWAGHHRPAFKLFDYFFGPMRYSDDHPYAPWYNTVAWLVLATPVPTLVLGFLGLRSYSRGTRTAPGQPHSTSFALLLHWATLMIVRALPGVPPNDGIRLLLPAFGFWCVFAGIGARRVWDAASCFQGAAWREKTVRAALVTALAASALNVARYYPQTLSHYSLLVGGVRGASRIGLEPTYWWDALDDEVLDWLNAHTGPRDPVAFSEAPSYNLALLRGWNRLRTGVADPSWGRVFTWYVLQNRPSLLTLADRSLIRSEKPVYTKYAGHHSQDPQDVPADLKVPLILIFSYDQYKRAVLSSQLHGD